MKTIKTGAFAVAAASLSGCAEMHTADFKDNRDSIDEFKTAITDQSEHGVTEISSGLIIDDIFVNTSALSVPKERESLIPDYIPKTIAFINKESMRETELKQVLLSDYGVRIDFIRLINQEEDDDKANEATNPLDAESGAAKGDNPNAVLPTPTMGGTNLGIGGASERPYVSKTTEEHSKDLFTGLNEKEYDEWYVKPISFNGKLTDFMDIIAADRELSWKFDSNSNTFVFYDIETRIYEVIDNTGEYETELEISTESKSDGSTGDGGASDKSATSQSVSFIDKAKHWEDLMLTIESMLSPDGKATFDQKNGMITVTDTDSVQEKISSIIDKLNEKNGSMVYLDIMYLKIKLDKSSEIGVDFDADDVLSSIGSGSITGGMTSNLPLGAMENLLNINFTKAGVKAMIGSIQKYGSISTKYEMPISTMNNMPHPYQTVIEEKYISKVEEEKEGEGEDEKVSRTAETEFNKTGLTSIFTPRIYKDNVIVSGRLSLTENLAMVEKENMGNIMLPKNSGETHIVKSIIPNGVTRIVSIQKITKTTAGSQGPAGEDSWMLGGKENSSNSDELAIIMVTPYIIK